MSTEDAIKIVLASARQVAENEMRDKIAEAADIAETFYNNALELFKSFNQDNK